MDGRALVQKLVHQAIWGNYSLDDIVSYAATATKDIVQQAGGVDYILPLYRKSINFNLPPATATNETKVSILHRCPHYPLSRAYLYSALYTGSNQDIAFSDGAFQVYDECNRYSIMQIRTTRTASLLSTSCP